MPRFSWAALMLLAARAALGECEGPVGTRPIPLPIYSTEPNEGSTFGFMPVFLRVCERTGRTESILAPSLSWNDTIHATGTVRFFGYPSDWQEVTVIGSLSTRINSNILVRFTDLVPEPGRFTRFLELRWERNVFYRFFGIGPETTAADETSYTRVRVHANGRVGLNLGGHWNAGVELSAHLDDVQDLGVPGLPLSRRVFPATPGMHGSSTMGEAVTLRYDSRPHADYSDRGALLDFALGPVEGLRRSPTFLRGRAEARALVPQTEALSLAGRFAALFASSKDAPFYEQSALGGAFLLRGFTESRFVDQDAWTVEVEERVRVVQLHLFGVTADARVDPFIGAGQVFESVNHALSHPRPVAGVGFRAFVHPNVVGRIDVATGGEGSAVYVEIAYPY